MSKENFVESAKKSDYVMIDGRLAVIGYVIDDEMKVVYVSNNEAEVLDLVDFVDFEDVRLFCLSDPKEATDVVTVSYNFKETVWKEKTQTETISLSKEAQGKFVEALARDDFVSNEKLL